MDEANKTAHEIATDIFLELSPIKSIEPKYFSWLFRNDDSQKKRFDYCRYDEKFRWSFGNLFFKWCSFNGGMRRKSTVMYW